MKNEIFYPSFSQRRMDLRIDWQYSPIKDWQQFLELAEYRAVRVADAINEKIDNLTHKQITDTYLELYKQL